MSRSARAHAPSRGVHGVRGAVRRGGRAWFDRLTTNGDPARSERRSNAPDGNPTRTPCNPPHSRAGVAGTRAQRFGMLIEDGVVKHLAVEAPGQFEVSSAEALLKVA